MIDERVIDPAIKNMLINNEPFQYCNLIKFERPSRPDISSGKVSTSAVRYTYLTDASRDVDFNDGSVDLNGTANGAQTYIANKVLKVSGVSESTEAKANNVSIVLDGNGIGAAVSTYIIVTVVSSGVFDIQLPSDLDLVSYGFREGDKILLTGDVSGYVNIQNFRSGNVIRTKKIDTDLTNSAGNVTLSLASEEIRSVLLNKNASDYSSFINREVFIYRAYFQNGSIVGTPTLLFKGIISNVGFEDEESIRVTWGLTSHWGDFSQVKGRITSDDFHRALDSSGIPQPDSALKPIYAYDKGFNHSETSINLLATYTVQVEKQDVKYKNGFLGIGAKVKVKKYLVPEDRNTNLDFQLNAKSIPVIYGVRTTKGLPIFADTLNTNSAEVYVASVLSEGVIGGLYDILIDGKSLICNDLADFTARSTQTSDNTVEVVCRGRADRGDVLGGISSISTTPVDFYVNDFVSDFNNFNYNKSYLTNYASYQVPTNTYFSTIGKGILHGESILLTSPIEMSIDLFGGESNQVAASQLVNIAANKNFKIQNDYWAGTDTAEYWGPNHRLIDTAYVVAKYKIKEGDTTIPDIDFVVRGKLLKSYNYDYSFSHYEKASGEVADNFKLGSIVTLYAENGTTVLNSNVQIIDKWTFVRSDGFQETRFRWDVVPTLNFVDGVPSLTKFIMKSESNTWTMITHNYVENSGSIPVEISSPITSISDSLGSIQINYTANTNLTIGGDFIQYSPAYSIVNSSNGYINNEYFSDAILLGNINSNRIVTKYRTNRISTNGVLS